MNHTRKNIRLGTFLNVGIGIVFILAAVIVVITVNYSMRRQALIEARSKARIIIDRNLATHTYFSQIMKPSIFAWSEPFRTKEYFDHTWMSSTYAIREIEKYFNSFNPSGYSFKDSAINARSPENEADEFERAFLEKLNADKRLESESTVRTINGKSYLVVLRKGEVMEASCLRCHSNPKDAPKGLTDYYGSERSFNRKAGDTISAVSLRIPLSEAYGAANVFSLELSAILLIVLACLFTIQYWFYRRYLLEPLNVMRDKANQIATHEGHLGEQIPQPFGRELNELTATFNEMSVKLRHDRDHLEELINIRTEALRERDTQFMKLSAWVPGMIYQFTKRPDGTYCVPFSTEAIKDIFGCSPKDVRDDFSPIANIIVPQDFDKVVGSIKYSATHLTIWTCEYRVQIPGQSIRWILGKSTPEKLADGSITWYGFNADITESKRAEESLQQTMEKLRKSLSGTIQAMSFTVEIRDPYTAGHQRRVSSLARAIAQELGLPADTIDNIRLASSIHDIGKISVPAEILVKPGKISDIEMSLIKLHAQSGYDILKDVELPNPMAEIVLQHHERLDGSGYPQGLKDGEILLESQIVSVADVVEAMASHRPYRPSLGIHAALEEIQKNKGILYHAEVVDVCLRLFREKGFQLEGG